MSSLLQQNSVNLQEILNTINALPEEENLGAELSTQSNLISEQDAKIAELAQVLAGKAGGGSGAEIETCTGIVRFDAPGMGGLIYYINSNLDLNSIELFEGATFSPLKNSILYIADGWTSDSYSSENAQQLNYEMGTSAYFVTGDFTLTYT